MRQRTNAVWGIPLQELKDAVKTSNSLSEILRHFDMKSRGNIKTIKKRMIEEGIDYSHIPLGKYCNVGRKFDGFENKRKIPLSEVMVENSTYNRCHLKRRLLKNGTLENKCYNCGLLPIWDSKELVMVLDHSNGINNDHREENLRLLCPNCNSQTPTFSGRNTRKMRFKKERHGNAI